MKKAVIAAKLKIFALLFIFAAAVALATSGQLQYGVMAGWDERTI